jgi:hypothetical protein
MTMKEVMAACARARRLCCTDSERMGADRAAAAILDAAGVPATGPARAEFIAIAKG